MGHGAAAVPQAAQPGPAGPATCWPPQRRVSSSFLHFLLSEAQINQSWVGRGFLKAAQCGAAVSSLAMV